VPAEQFGGFALSGAKGALQSRSERETSKEIKERERSSFIDEEWHGQQMRNSSIIKEKSDREH
jgi:hypothetical protein